MDQLNVVGQMVNVKGAAIAAAEPASAAVQLAHRNKGLPICCATGHSLPIIQEACCCGPLSARAAAGWLLVASALQALPGSQLAG